MRIWTRWIRNQPVFAQHQTRRCLLHTKFPVVSPHQLLHPQAINKLRLPQEQYLCNIQVWWILHGTAVICTTLYIIVSSTHTHTRSLSLSLRLSTYIFSRAVSAEHRISHFSSQTGGTAWHRHSLINAVLRISQLKDRGCVHTVYPVIVIYPPEWRTSSYVIQITSTTKNGYATIV
jgi:hypothetical protein